MIKLHPTEHLSPTQSKAYTGLISGRPVAVTSQSVGPLIEIISLLVTDESIAISCNTHTLRIAKDYKSRHSKDATITNQDHYIVRYRKAVEKLKQTYEHCYPNDAACIHHEYWTVLQSLELDNENSIDIDDRFADLPTYITKSISGLDDILFSYKPTWSRYDEIDPLKDAYYTSQNDNSLNQYLTMWISNVKATYNDMQKGLREIVDVEKYRLLSIQKQLTQHLVNYQHNQSEVELKQMRQKIAFIMADLPKDSYKEFTDLVMFALSNWESATAKYLSKYRRRFNSRNQPSVLIYEAMQELRVVLRDIENNGSLKLELPSNPLSYETQIAQTQTLLSQLEYCQSWMRYESDYIKWKKFYFGLSTTEKRTVEALTSLDKDELQKQLDYIQLRNWKENIIDKGIPNANDSLEVFETYKELNETIDWSNINLVAESSKADYSLKYNGVSYVLSNTNTGETYTEISINDKALHKIKPTVTLDYYAKSMQANNLSNAMVATEANFRIFQTRELNIISSLDDRHTDQVLSLLSTANINELKGESYTDLIKGSILDEGKEKVVLVYDDLLNVQLTTHYIWQRLVLQSMSTAGYKVISINASDTLNGVSLAKQLSTYVTPRNISEKPVV